MTYVMSDIHGEYELFMRLLDKINYSDSDELIVCGDIIDKGDNPIKLAKTVFAMPNAYCIMGNHEHMFFKFYRSRMHSAIMDYDTILCLLQEYFKDTDGALLDWETVDRLTDLPYFIEREKFVCVHAGIPTDENGCLVDLRDADREELVNDRLFKSEHFLPKTDKCVFFGHTPTQYVKAGGILKYAKEGKDKNSTSIEDLCKVHLDTGVYFSGKLGAFRVDDCTSHFVTK